MDDTFNLGQVTGEARLVFDAHSRVRVLDNLAAAETPERILEQYPTRKPEHIAAAIAYAADLARERVVAVPTIGIRSGCERQRREYRASQRVRECAS